MTLIGVVVEHHGMVTKMRTANKDELIKFIDLDMLDNGKCPECGEPLPGKDNYCELCNVDWSRDIDKLMAEWLERGY